MPLDVRQLAERVHVSPPQLRRAFSKEFGMPLREYFLAVRLVAALEWIATEKAEAIALEIGYKSKKNWRLIFEAARERLKRSG